MESKLSIQLFPLTLSMAPTLADIAQQRDIWLQVRDRFPHPYTLADAEAFITLFLEQNPLLTYGIFAERQLCGVISLTPLTDVYRVSAEIGYFLGKSYWGRGITTEAVGQMTRIGYSSLPIERIFAGVFSSNPASMRVLEKNGFTLEGVAKRSIQKAGVILSEHVYALYRHT